MESSTKRPAVPAFVAKLLGPLEIIALATTILGMTFKYLLLPGADEVLMVGMSSLSAVYFLKANVSIAEKKEGQSFADLLVTTIFPRAGWIGCSVTIIGALFGILHLNGAHEMLQIGFIALPVCVLGSIYLIVRGASETSAAINMLYRAAPVCVFGIYMFMNLPTK